MALEEDFAAAQTRVRSLSRTPDASDLLELYAFYKQGSNGDVQGSRPGMLDFKGRAKYDAWTAKKGIARDAAQRAYVELVGKLATKYG
jgi:diazepam-binding inhibitor (GABA receptor modulator, acyl-CoA-binding protein)